MKVTPQGVGVAADPSPSRRPRTSARLGGKGTKNGWENGQLQTHTNFTVYIQYIYIYIYSTTLNGIDVFLFPKLFNFSKQILHAVRFAFWPPNLDVSSSPRRWLCGSSNWKHCMAWNC